MTALLEYQQYMPHGMCLLWEPWLVLLWSGSDLMIFTAYMAIPLALVLVLRRRPDVAHRGLVALFAGFILLCGVTHALSIVTLWTPIYPLVGVVKLATGLISLATAAVLFRLIPDLARIPTPNRHEEVIAQLEQTLADLSRSRDELDARVQERTAQLNAANAQLSLTARDAVQRSRNLIHIVSSLTRPGVEDNQYPARFLSELRGRINALAIATSTVMEQDDAARASLERVVRRQVEPIFAEPAAQLSSEGPEVEIGAQGAQQISLVAWELASHFVQMSRTEQAMMRIDIAWQVDSAPGEDDRFVFEWRERIAAPAMSELAIAGGVADDHGDDAPTRNPLDEFSETLLTRIVPRLLGGTGQVMLDGAHLTYRLECPLDALGHSHEDRPDLAEDRLLGGSPGDGSEAEKQAGGIAR